MSFRFIHTADLQIGKKFGQFPANIASRLQDARFEIVKKIAELAIERHAEAILVAGDCFDTISVSNETLRRFRVMTKKFRGKWILLPGNHDHAGAESPWNRLRKLNLPDNIVIVDEPKPFMFENKAVILPAPLQRKQEVTDLTNWFNTCDTDEGLIRVGLAHGSVESFSKDKHTNPIATDRCEQAQLDYLALGDWHGCKQISERMRYAGTPEPDRFRDNKPGYVLDVRIDHAGDQPQVEPIRVAQYHWEKKSIDILSGDEIKKIYADKNLYSTVLELELNGTVNLATSASIAEDCEELRARVLYLGLIDLLCLEPRPSDFDALNASGFIGSAFNKLQGMQSEPAKKALSLLYYLYHHNKEKS